MKKKPVLSVSELKALRDEAADTRRTVAAIESEQYGAGNRGASIDKHKMLSHAQKMEKLAAEHSAEKLRGGDRDKLAKRSEELRSRIQEGMLTNNEMNNLRQHPNSPIKHLEWERRNAGAIHEYKQAMRRLEPNDPGAGSVERFRR